MDIELEDHAGSSGTVKTRGYWWTRSGDSLVCILGWGVGGCNVGEGRVHNGVKHKMLSPPHSCSFLLCLTAVSGERSLSAALTCASSLTVPSVAWVLVVAGLAHRPSSRVGSQSAGREGLLFLLLAFIHKIV